MKKEKGEERKTSSLERYITVHCKLQDNKNNPRNTDDLNTLVKLNMSL